MRQKPTYPEDGSFHEAFGRALKVLRAERGLERKELAELAGLSYPYVSEIETGKKRPSSRAVLALAEALGVPAHHLWEMADALQTQAAMSPAPAESTGSSYFHSDERLAPASLSPPAAMPRLAAPASAPRKRLERLRRGSAKQERVEHEVVVPAEQELPTAEPLIDELLAAASSLPERDLRHLIELARRLSR